MNAGALMSSTGNARSSPATRQVTLWCWNDAEVLRDFSAHIDDCLTPSEIHAMPPTAAAAMRRTARFALRLILGGICRLPPRQMLLRRTHTGQPRLVSPPGGDEVSFSVSHHGGHGVLAITEAGLLGVDLGDEAGPWRHLKLEACVKAAGGTLNAGLTDPSATAGWSLRYLRPVPGMRLVLATEIACGAVRLHRPSATLRHLQQRLDELAWLRHS